MGVVVVVLFRLDSLEPQTAVPLLGIGMTCAGVAMLSKSDERNATDILTKQAYELPKKWRCGAICQADGEETETGHQYRINDEYQS